MPTSAMTSPDEWDPLGSSNEKKWKLTRERWDWFGALLPSLVQALHAHVRNVHGGKQLNKVSIVCFSSLLLIFV
jgi:hypothetical protein